MQSGWAACRPRHGLAQHPDRAVRRRSVRPMTGRGSRAKAVRNPPWLCAAWGILRCKAVKTARNPVQPQRPHRAPAGPSLQTQGRPLDGPAHTRAQTCPMPPRHQRDRERKAARPPWSGPRVTRAVPHQTPHGAAVAAKAIANSHHPANAQKPHPKPALAQAQDPGTNQSRGARSKTRCDENPGETARDAHILRKVWPRTPQSGVASEDTCPFFRKTGAEP